MSIVLQLARRINNNLAARLNIFQNRDHLVFRNRNASAGKFQAFGVVFVVTN